VVAGLVGSRSRSRSRRKPQPLRLSFVSFGDACGVVRERAWLRGVVGGTAVPLPFAVVKAA